MDTKEYQVIQGTVPQIDADGVKFIVDVGGGLQQEWFVPVQPEYCQPDAYAEMYNIPQSLCFFEAVNVIGGVYSMRVEILMDGAGKVTSGSVRLTEPVCVTRKAYTPESCQENIN